MSIAEAIVEHVETTLKYEIQGVRGRWNRRKKLVQKIIDNITKRIRGQVLVTKGGALHYNYELRIVKKGVHY